MKKYLLPLSVFLVALFIGTSQSRANETLECFQTLHDLRVEYKTNGARHKHTPDGECWHIGRWHNGNAYAFHNATDHHKVNAWHKLPVRKHWNHAKTTPYRMFGEFDTYNVFKSGNSMYRDSIVEPMQ